eukprot:TRINITY_DN21340_c0_g2_i2.p1 TRINITY_DN21340_c0_g2~~TRINITY_DN21340_c0_g2_i2.p1  ORF type:complete len:368 (-),score=55.15 TRINITY_DN21340_c0_g2_i2:71-1174(-)
MRPTDGPSRTCRHFLAGRCTYGDQCSFRHDGGAPPEWVPEPTMWLPPPPMPSIHMRQFAFHPPPPLPPSASRGGPHDSPNVCRHFLSGRCTYGDNCSFTHAVEAPAGKGHNGVWEAPVALPPPPAPVPPPAPPAPPKIQRSAGGGGGGDLPRGVCRHFLAGRCTYGDACTFSHGIGDSEGDVEAAATAQGVLLMDERRPWDEQRLVGDGLGCAASAPRSSGSDTVDSPAGPVCRHFLAGRCTYGDQCRFPHPVDEEELDPLELELSETMDEKEIEGARKLEAALADEVLPEEAEDGEALSKPLPGVPSAVSRPSGALRPGLIFSPVSSGKVANAPSSSSAPSCRHFLAGKCTYGDTCRFAHHRASPY